MTRPARRVAAGLGLTAALGLGALAYGSLVERRRFTVREEHLPILPPGARPFTILHLSDLHMAPWQRDKQEFVRSLARYEPDLVVDTGDNLGHVDGLSGVRRALEVFRGVPGAYVHGSNDRWGPVWKNPLGYLVKPSKVKNRAPRLDTAAMERFFDDELGWFDLNNAARAVEHRGLRLELFGTGDAHRRWDDLRALPGTLAELRAAATWSADTLDPPVRLGVTHAPYQRVLDAFVDEGADLILAGHTHGGQVRVPGLPALVTNCDIPREQAQGLSSWAHRGRSAALNVSAGLGTSIYAPVRFACAPEAIVVTLTAPEIGYS
jgi:predicted MPP superfamily phosphohydrolase